ncbi:MAG: hypothetical protein A2117_00685 [Candidatus Wildermuthbacteria bacterium GWA2_46_15]|uniref:Transcriptional repressor PaaX-like central Cas2-like domain-containing protein n=1 Tax=Candidatus Wildermuthbacteria bacterium GWA2_46_15 TaxID=1802443 RepID=A0A1G2QPB6_9BACT|nr:MAG: hypothetical protein A2117_00685 [Candidatus Wildermuthbacteria bacterium GWA2_46_15]
MGILPKTYFTIGNLAESIQEDIAKHNKRKVKKEDIKKAFYKLYSLEKKAEEYNFTDLYWRALRSGYIVENRAVNDLIVTLTDKAKLKILEAKFARAARLKSDKYILVSFDIPQSHTAARNYLRSFLVRTGFKLIQKSVLLGHADVAEELMKLLKEHAVSDWVKCFYVSKMIG